VSPSKKPPRPKPIKLAKKPSKVTNRQIARFRGEDQTPESKRQFGITLVVLDGPLRGLVPFPRSDLYRGQERWEYPVLFGSATYVLDRIEDDVHYYRWENDGRSGSET